jgi:hypothetical protein
MKKPVFIVVLLLASISSFTQVSKPGKPAFMVTYKENGKNANESWTYTATIKFSLSNWNEPLRGKGYTPETRKLPLDFDAAAFLKLDPGDKIKFYPSEVDESGSGSHGSYTRILTPDGVETITETEESTGTHTIVTTDADYRKGNGIPTNENFRQNARYYQLGELAELERTATGAILYAFTAVGNNLSEWAVGEETMDQVFPEVEKFVLTDKDIQSWQQISRTNIRSGSYDEENLTVKLTIKMEVPVTENAEVTIDGCSELGVGEQGQVTAKGKPEGGTYRFWVEPSGILNVTSGGASATLNGSSSGRGTLYVEYTTPEGKTAQATKTAACIKLDSYNGGEAIPQIAFYDIDGKRLSGIKEISVSVEPSDAADLLTFVAADPGVLSALNVGEKVDLQGVHEGKTTLQAQTSCGGKTGPVVEVEVVNCDDETKATLEEMMRVAKEGQKEAYEEIERIMDSEEFKEAADNIKKSTIELAEKTALTIAASGENEGAVEAAVQIAEAGATMKDLITSHTSEDLSFNELTAMMKVTGANLLKAIAGNMELIKASNEFGKQLGTLIGTDIELQNAMSIAEQANKRVEEIVRCQKICKSSTEKSSDKKEQTTKPSTDQTKPPKTDQNGDAEQKTADEGQHTGQDNGDQTNGGDEVSPPPPTSEPRSVSLPYTQDGNCGCNSSKELGLNREGFSTLQTGMENLGKCVDSFTNGPLAEYSITLGKWQDLIDSVESDIKAGPAIFQKKTGETAAKIDSLIGLTNKYDQAGKSFIGEFEKCPESVSSGLELLQSAATITVDMVTTNY